MNRKIFFSSMSIIAAVALTAGSAFAAFATTATANNSTFSSANPHLQLAPDVSDSPGAFADAITGFNLPGLIPGTPLSLKFWIQNSGGVNDGSLSISTLFQNPSGTGSGNGNLETNLDVSLSCTDGLNVTQDKFVNWESGSGKALNGGTLAPGANTQCTMTVGLPSGNTNQNQSLNFNAVFGGTAGL